MNDEELALFVHSAGDRILIRNFVKNHVSSGQRKETLIKTVRERLAAIRSKRLVAVPERKRIQKNVGGESSGPNMRSTRHLYLGWKHTEASKIILVIEKKGGVVLSFC